MLKLKAVIFRTLLLWIRIKMDFWKIKNIFRFEQTKDISVEKKKRLDRKLHIIKLCQIAILLTLFNLCEIFPAARSLPVDRTKLHR